jgi:hypothetical protein
MSSTAVKNEATSVGFGADELKANAANYREHKRIVDAASGYDNLEDAIAALRDVWGILEDQVKDGSGYTPDRGLGFGSDNASQIAEAIIGLRPTVGSTRKAFATLGK